MTFLRIFVSLLNWAHAVCAATPSPAGQAALEPPARRDHLQPLVVPAQPGAPATAPVGPGHPRRLLHLPGSPARRRGCACASHRRAASRAQHAAALPARGHRRRRRRPRRAARQVAVDRLQPGAAVLALLFIRQARYLSICRLEWGGKLIMITHSLPSKLVK